MAACILGIFVVTISLCSCNATANFKSSSDVSNTETQSSTKVSSSNTQTSSIADDAKQDGVPLTDDKTQYENLVDEFNKESDSYNADLKNIRDLVVTAGNLESYFECADLPHDSSTVTLNINGGDDSYCKISKDSKYQSLNEFYDAFSKVWSDNKMKYFKDPSKSKYIEYNG